MVHVLQNASFLVGIGEDDGCIHSLRMNMPAHETLVEFVEPRSLLDTAPMCLWGQWELRDSFTSYKPSDARFSMTSDGESVESCWETNGFTISIRRTLYDTHLAETVSLHAQQTMVVTDFSVAFRPIITNFLDASNLAVGEHSNYIHTDDARFAYHWFAGGSYAHLMFTEVSGRGPHLGICLSDGRIHGLTTPYLHGGPALVNDYLAFGTHMMYPRLHMTSYATHKEEDEYPQPVLDMHLGDTESFTLNYFRFDDLDDFATRTRTLCKQPTFDYPRFWHVGKDLSIDIHLPDADMPVTARYQGKAFTVESLGNGQYRLPFRAERSGLHRVSVEYGGKQTFILLEAVHDVTELLDKRVEYILGTQQCMEPTDPRYAGIFMTDMPTGELFTRDDLYTVQVAGSGEMVCSGQLVVYRNLIDPDPEQIARIELYANRWLREHCQDEDFSTPLNPLNRLKYKGRGWKYAAGLAKIFNNPDFPAEKAWRVHNANWIAPFYFLLSEMPESLLTMQSSSVYLDWAYQTYLWFFETMPQQSADQSYFIPRVIAKLRRNRQIKAADQLQARWLAFVERLEVNAENIGSGYFVYDDSMFYCSAIPLLIESRIDAAYRYLESYPYSVGLSYDPRVQTMFRYWDDYLTDVHYRMMPYLTRPHLWSITDAYPLLQYYERTHDEAALDSAYQNIMAFYEHYHFGYRWNKWGEMRLGQGHPGFLPSLDLHTQERTCADQDPAFVTYLETFGTHCYVTPSGRAVNAALDGNRIESWAAFPRAYHLDDQNLLVECAPYRLSMLWIDLSGGRLKVMVKNHSRDTVNGHLTLTGATNQTVPVTLAPHGELLLDMSAGQDYLDIPREV